MTGIAYTNASAGLEARLREVELMTAERDTNGGVVPVWKGVTSQRDSSGNLKTETVTDGTSTWVRSYTTTGSGQVNSGWVKK